MMKKTIAFGAAGLAASAGIFALGYFAGTGPVSGKVGEMPIVSAATENAIGRAEVETILRDYLLTNPELMIEVQTALETKQREQQRLAQLEIISEASEEIFKASYDGIIGNPDGKTTVVEFFDYNCSFCKRALSDMEAMVAADPDLRFVMKEFPILGPDSQEAHLVSMAFRALMPEKYGEFHRGLLGGAGKADGASAMKLALSLGADEAALRQKMQDPVIEQAFAATYDLANKLSITGTPSYVVGDEVVFGALGQDVLEEKIANLRTCDSATC
jgi:protein-disulfide isomerase